MLATLLAAAAAQAQEQTPPDPPAGLSVEVRIGDPTITWQPDPDGNPEYHRIWRSTAGEDKTQAAGRTGSAETVSFTDTGAEAGQTHTYRVTAVNAAGESASSEPATITLRPPPIGFTATAIHPTTGEKINRRPPGASTGRHAPPVVLTTLRESTLLHYAAPRPPITWSGTAEEFGRIRQTPSYRRALWALTRILNFITAAAAWPLATPEPWTR